MTSEIAARLYADVVAPLVLGGVLRPGRVIGGAAALRLEEFSRAVDTDLRSRTDLGRVHVARGLLPIDLVPEASRHDWTLFAAVHDWLAAASPELASVLSPRAPDRALDLVAGTLDHVRPVRDSHEALSRHTYFSRLLAIRRSDVHVSFWAGSRTFLGTKPPERLLAWPEFRRVRSATTARPLATLAEHGAKVDKARWLALLERILRLTPLTDLATATREAPEFSWSKETLAFCATEVGKTLCERVLAKHDGEDVLVALGRATRTLTGAEAWRAVGVASEVLSRVVFRVALESSSGEWSRLIGAAERSPDMFCGLAVGALASVDATERELSRHDASLARGRILPLARSPEARALLGEKSSPEG